MLVWRQHRLCFVCLWLRPLRSWLFEANARKTQTGRLSKHRYVTCQSRSIAAWHNRVVCEESMSEQTIHMIKKARRTTFISNCGLMGLIQIVKVRHSKFNKIRRRRALCSAYDSSTVHLVRFSLKNDLLTKTARPGNTTLGRKLASKDKCEERNKDNVPCHLTSTHSSLEIPLSITAAHCYNQMCYLRDMWPLLYLYKGRGDDSTGSPG